ncbi:hypothetical protein SAMN05444143_11912 [Flavobacterium succinicans]|uniref:Uncharacterized protein n=1 Tax=Flavobacterium succinicans TaxID=29536 RepID=A0A1I4ZXQ4_9FLAO|nr:hypothetical protein SAMN05444143_11912 [Flavobacterium succinicans]
MIKIELSLYKNINNVTSHNTRYKQFGQLA